MILVVNVINVVILLVVFIISKPIIILEILIYYLYHYWFDCYNVHCPYHYHCTYCVFLLLSSWL